MDRSLLLRMELAPTAMVGLGKNGARIVERFFELLPASVRHVGTLQPVTQGLIQKLPVEQRPRGIESGYKLLLERAISASRAPDNSDGTLSLEQHELKLDHERYRVVVLASPFEELPFSLPALLSTLEDMGEQTGISDLLVDIVLVGEFQPGPASKRRARQHLADTAATISAQSAAIDGRARISHRFFWLDHTNERGVNLRRQLDTFDEVACRILELLLSPASKGVIPEPSDFYEEGAPVLNVHSLGFNSMEVPLVSLVRIGTLQALSALFAAASDSKAKVVPEELQDSLEIAADLSDEQIHNHLMRSPAAHSAERVGARLRTLPASHFILGGEPSPELVTLRAGLDHLLGQTKEELGASDSLIPLAKRQIAEVNKILRRHITSDPHAMGEAEAALDSLWKNWQEQQRHIQNKVNHIRREVEQRGRKVAWLFDENEKRHNKLTWKHPILIVILKSLGVALPVAALSGFASFALPDLQDLAVKLVAVSGIASFLTGLFLFMGRYFHDRSVIPQLLHELGESTDRRLELLAEEEHLRFLAHMEQEFRDSSARMEAHRDLLSRTASQLSTEAMREIEGLRKKGSDFHKVFPVSDPDIKSVIERFMGAEEFEDSLIEVIGELPHDRAESVAAKEKAIAWALSEILPKLRSEADLQPASVLRNLTPGVAGWDDLLSSFRRIAAPWWRESRRNPLSLAPATQTFDGGVERAVERKLLFAAPSFEPRSLRNAINSIGGYVYNGTLSHSFTLYSIVSGITLESLVAQSENEKEVTSTLSL